MIKVILICLVLRVRAEPQCSKFHYEEQLLEKMVRMEFQMEQRNKELEQCLIDKRTDIQGLLGRLDAALSDLTEEKKTLQHKADQVFSDFMDNSTRLNNELQQSLQSLSKDNVVFYARKVRNTSPTTDEVTVFQQTMTDNTGSYNNNTGKVTAPVEGIYMFTVNICSEEVYYTDFTIMQNGAKYAQSRCYDKEYPDCDSVQAMISLKRGDSVYSTITSGGSHLVEDEGKYWNSFGGVRVSGV
ncbi:EMILIN-2-like [Dreissena polymorpha]|uniref:C1q domain-containing protein n=1 Tax=Dreissena polymorpha TaxID=45954 RepID=A0A9D4LRW6_DREPO|nr:EMILIN-2-like [Dreissena polymorpha]KAH3863872.1 hypothetical protein DPMN_026877 [Dreissena polymorpha]